MTRQRHHRIFLMVKISKKLPSQLTLIGVLTGSLSKETMTQSSIATNPCPWRKSLWVSVVIYQLNCMGRLALPLPVLRLYFQHVSVFHVLFKKHPCTPLKMKVCPSHLSYTERGRQEGFLRAQCLEILNTTVLTLKGNQTLCCKSGEAKDQISVMQ